MAASAIGRGLVWHVYPNRPLSALLIMLLRTDGSGHMSTSARRAGDVLYIHLYISVLAVFFRLGSIYAFYGKRRLHQTPF